ncbi:MAG: OmpH family outer membrane protein [Verrucomicrobia bacterium]|nr:OmpH family outer membrane protein [Verrucomicrobiota bacterium]
MIPISIHMKKCLIPSLVATVVIAMGSLAQAETKIGLVDMNKIFSSYYKTEQAKKRIDEAQTVAQKELQDLVDVFNKNLDAIRKLNEELNKPELSKEAKEKKAKERDEKAEESKRQEKEIVELRQRRLKDLQDQAARMRAGIVEEIRKLVNDKVKSDQYDLVLDKSGLSSNGVEVVLYSKDTADFSEDIIKALNASKPKDAANPAQSGKSK